MTAVLLITPDVIFAFAGCHTFWRWRLRRRPLIGHLPAFEQTGIAAEVEAWLRSQ